MLDNHYSQILNNSSNLHKMQEAPNYAFHAPPHPLQDTPSLEQMILVKQEAGNHTPAGKEIHSLKKQVNNQILQPTPQKRDDKRYSIPNTPLNTNHKRSYNSSQIKSEFTSELDDDDNETNGRNARGSNESPF